MALGRGLSLTFRDSSEAPQAYVDSTSQLEPLEMFSVLTYCRAFTESEGEPDNAVHLMISGCIDSVNIDTLVPVRNSVNVRRAK